MPEHFFRPAHVVTMVVALCAAAVLAPVAVDAATGSSVNIVDKLNPGPRHGSPPRARSGPPRPTR